MGGGARRGGEKNRYDARDAKGEGVEGTRHDTTPERRGSRGSSLGRTSASLCHSTKPLSHRTKTLSLESTQLFQRENFGDLQRGPAPGSVKGVKL